VPKGKEQHSTYLALTQRISQPAPIVTNSISQYKFKLSVLKSDRRNVKEASDFSHYKGKKSHLFGWSILIQVFQALEKTNASIFKLDSS
jgi:hypothetical protein